MFTAEPSITGTNDSRQAKSQRWGVWPLVVCWLSFTILATLGTEAMNQNWFRGNFGLANAFVAMLFGLIGLATVIGGLMARSWIVGWLAAVLLACLQTVLPIFFRPFSVPNSEYDFQTLPVCSLWPMFFLSSCAPLLIMRALFGWTLRRTSQPAIPRSRSSLEDLLLLGVVIACAMKISQVFVYNYGQGSLSQLLVIIVAFSALSCVCVPLVVWITFRARNWTKRSFGWTILSAITLGVFFVQDGFMRPSGWADALRNFPDMLIPTAAACLTVGIGLTSLLASGYQLTYFAKGFRTSPAQPAEPTSLAEPIKSDDSTTRTEWLEDAQVMPPRHAFEFGPKWQARALTVLLICIAVASTIGIDSSRQKVVGFFEKLSSKDLLHVNLKSDESIEGIQFGPDFTDADLDRYVKYANSLTSLSLAGTKVTDAVVPKLKAFSKLMHLDLSNTAITDAGLQQLLNQSGSDAESYEGISILSLADTQVTWAGIEKFLEGKKLLTLDVSGLGITDQQVVKLHAIMALTLSRNPITDEGLSALLNTGRPSYLDVSDTAVTGTALATSRCPMELNLDGTQVSDATLTAILSAGKLRRVSLARTKVTAAVLPSLAGMAVRLGDGPITEDDLASLNTISFMHLGLNGQQFTGKCMAIGKIQTDSLDLSNSSVTDDVVLSFPRRYARFVGLAHTKIADKAVQRLFAREIDLRGTRVTAAGLAAIHSYFGIVLSHNQFSPSDMALLDQAKVEIKERSAKRLGP